MGRTLLAVVLLTVLLAGGCVSVPLLDSLGWEKPTQAVPSNPFGTQAQAGKPVKAYSRAPASSDLAMRVDTVGRKILAANPQIGLRPLFATYGSSKPEIFHQGTSMVNITDSLVQQCKTEAQLAAVLCQELAEMVAERDALANPKTRYPQRPLPMDVPIGNAGQGASPDLTRLPELARYDKRKAQGDRAPDPKVLAAGYLEKAGYARDELNAVAPLLRTAEANGDVETHLKTYNVGQWVPAK